ncbi:MAG: preprotein translocase subunit SecG [Hyphomicrobiaceae bacterium]
MITVILVVHLLIAAAMVGVVLLQRSEGGALGMGGGGGGGGFLTGRGTANLLTRTTAILAACFFATSIALSLLSGRGGAPTSVFGSPTTTAPATGGVLDSLKQGDNQRLPSVPQSK